MVTTSEFLTFKLGEELFGIEVSNVDEVIKATIEVPKRVQWLVEVMEEVPKGGKGI